MGHIRYIHAGAMYLARPLPSSAGDLYLTSLTGMSRCSVCLQCVKLFSNVLCDSNQYAWFVWHSLDIGPARLDTTDA